MMIKAVAFDMDGLMFDTEDVYWKAASKLLGRRGFEYTPELNAAVMGRTPRYCFELLKDRCSLPESWQELQKESEDLFLELLDDGFSTMPGLYELLDALEDRGIPKAICTSSEKRVVTEVLQRKNLAGRFQFVLTAQDIVRGKPDPDIYLKAAQKFGVEPSEMMVLEDSEAGCRAGAAAGAFTVVVVAHHNANGDFSLADLTVFALDEPEVLQRIWRCS